MRLVLALLIVAGFTCPPCAPAHAGDIVVRKPTSGAGVAAAGRQGAPPAPRRNLPHEFIAPGFDLARSITSAARNRSGRLDVFARARALAQSRAALGPDALRRELMPTVPGQDTVRIAMLRVDFLNDREGGRSSGDGKFDLSPRDTINRPLDPTPHHRPFWQAHGEAMSRYFHAQTAGRTIVEFTVYPTATDSAFHLTDMADYGPWRFSPEIYRDAVDLFRDCLVAADTTESIPWSTFDRIFIVHAGSDLQSDVNQDSPLDIPTFTIGVADTDVVVLGPAGQDSVFGGVIAPETIRQDDYEGVVNAVFAHEAGHLIYGFRDVYDVATGLPTVGYWSLMDVGNLLGNPVTFPSGTSVYATGVLPPSIDPWQKRLIYPDVPLARFPNYGAEETLVNSSEGFEVLQVPLSGEEYLLLENRLDDLNGNGLLTLTRDSTGVILGPSSSDTLEYDFLVPGPGILAWHVDESVADFFGPRADPGYGLNVNRSRFGLEIVEADGLDDLGDFDSPFALGVPSDTWKDGPNDRLNWNTVPRLRTHSRTNPHLDLEFTSLPGPTMSLVVNREWDKDGWPVKVVQPPGGISPAVSPVGVPELVRVAWTGGDSALHVRLADGTPAFPGGSDVAFKGTGPLTPVAVMPSATERRYVMARTDSLPGNGGVVHLLAVWSGGASQAGYLLPARVTAGPACSESAPDRILVGLENGTVWEIRTDAIRREVAEVSSSPVTGLALDGNRFAAAAADGFALIGDFASNTPDAAVNVQVARQLAAGNNQPILFRTSADGSPSGVLRRAVVVERSRGSVREIDQGAPDSPPLEPWQGRELGEPVGPPAMDDLDGDGQPEIAFLTASGRVGYWNLNGSLSPGWPPELEREGFASAAGPIVLEGTAAGPSLITPLGNGVLLALDGQRKNLPGFPLGLSVGTRGTPALDVAAVPPALYVAGGDTLLYGFGLDFDDVAGAQPGTSTWSAEGGNPARSYSDPNVYGGAVPGSGVAVVDGTLKAYPNPARRQPITFAFRLREAGRVELSIYDAAARLVERFERDGSASDNAITWDPTGRTSGLYVARIEVPGQVVSIPFALIR